jgi:uncharacterized membrane protein
MKFSIVERRDVNKFILNESLREVLSTIAIVALLITIVFIGTVLSFVIAGILGIAFVFLFVIYSYYSNTLFSHINYFTVIGNIEFEEVAVKIDDKEVAFDELKQTKFFIGFYQNCRRGRYQPLCDGISKVEWYFQDKYISYEFIIYSEKEYLKFEKLLMKIETKYSIQIFDIIRKDNLKVPALIK